ncbi:MAG TPA: HAD hydrolase-like protein [Candidatus Saccharimonadales bacterium]|nr:HAD hydrolase-like protein [Candidatus Saccharimonadales bacterium]
MNLTKKKFFIFDFDGVLINSTSIGCQKMQLILEKLGLPPIPQSFLSQHWGKKVLDLFELVSKEVGATPDQTKKMIEIDQLISSGLPYKFENELFVALNNLKLFNYYAGLITNRSNSSLNSVAKQTGMNFRLFDKIQTTDHYYHHKPDGRVFGPFTNWAKTRGIKPGEMVYFGDTISQDLKATRDFSPSLDFVGVVSGINTREEFLDAGVPLCRIVDFGKLPNFLHNIIREKVET